MTSTKPPLFAVLDRYLMSEILKTMLSLLLVLMLILAAHNFIRYLEQGSAGAIAHDVILTMLGLELLKAFGLLVTTTFFFAVMMTLGRMYRDSEMTALLAGGVGRGRIFRGYAWAILPVMLVSAAMTLVAKPWAHHQLAQYKDQQSEGGNEISSIGAGKFNESSRGEMIFYVQELSKDRSLMRNVFVQHRKQTDLGIVRSRDGYQYTDGETGDTYLVLQNGYRYDGEPGQPEYRISRFDKYAVRLSEGDPRALIMGPKLRSTAELWRSDQLADRAELQLRLFAPLAVLVFAVLSVPLSRAPPRQGMGGRMVLALLAYFLYANLEALSGSWMVLGVTPEWLGRWWVHLLMLGLAGLLMLMDSLWMAERLKRLDRQLGRRLGGQLGRTR
ncbi:MAG: LPS export ABC transporter permease LptF [Gammaproteobacteria bacterium]|nr:LPS export ABC transporter permease LptF [Gammaproteobacteria bacterium]